jgi:soluble lytic murein transglycosylase-like protein
VIAAAKQFGLCGSRGPDESKPVFSSPRTTPAERSAGAGCVSFVLATVVLLGTTQPREAAALQASQVVPDTVNRYTPRLFQRGFLFSPQFLARLLSAPAPERTEREILADSAEQRSRAAAYAERYNIDEALALTIVQSAVAEGLDPELGFRLVRVESVFRPAARGPGGSLGLTQLMPGTARDIDRNLRTDSQILDPVTNLRTGFRYLRSMIERYGGDVRLGLLAYNRGEIAVDRALRNGIDPENGYSAKVLGNLINRYTGHGLIESDK